MELSGNTIVITGGTSGIGRALAERFLGEGNRVIVCARRQDRLDELANLHPGLVTRVCDVADPAQRTAFFGWLVENHPGTNVFVNNAGIQLPGRIGKELDQDAVRSEVETNVLAVVHFSSLAADFLAGKPGAALVNVSSGLAFAPLAFVPVYCATKAFVHSFTLSLRHQLAARGVEVIEVIPPAVDTELGLSRRSDSAQSHGGMPVSEFVDGVLSGLREGRLEVAVGGAAHLRQKGEALFDGMNNR